MDSTTAGQRPKAAGPSLWRWPKTASIMGDGEAANIANTYANTIKIYLYLCSWPIFWCYPHWLPGAIQLVKSVSLYLLEQAKCVLNSMRSRIWGGHWKITKACISGNWFAWCGNGYRALWVFCTPLDPLTPMSCNIIFFIEIWEIPIVSLLFLLRGPIEPADPREIWHHFPLTRFT